MAKVVTIRLDRPLAAELRRHAIAAGLKESIAVRDLLRHALGLVKTPREAGWHEGFAAGKAEMMGRLSGGATQSPRRSR